MKHLTNDQLFHFTTNTLSPFDKKIVEHHLIQCPACAELYEDAVSFAELWEDPEPQNISTDFVSQVMGKIKSPTKLKSSNRSIIWNFSLSAAATFLLLNIGVFQQLTHTPAGMTTVVSTVSVQLKTATHNGESMIHNLKTTLEGVLQ